MGFVIDCIIGFIIDWFWVRFMLRLKVQHPVWFWTLMAAQLLLLAAILALVFRVAR